MYVFTAVTKSATLRRCEKCARDRTSHRTLEIARIIKAMIEVHGWPHVIHSISKIASSSIKSSISSAVKSATSSTSKSASHSATGSLIAHETHGAFDIVGCGELSRFDVNHTVKPLSAQQTHQETAGSGQSKNIHKLHLYIWISSKIRNRVSITVQLISLYGQRFRTSYCV